MAELVWKKHPVRLLFYLEWILLGIAFITIVAFLVPHHHFPRGLHSHSLRFLYNFTALSSLFVLGFMGYKMPFNAPLLSKIYIAISFSLSWLIFLLVGRGERLFMPLLLVVVIRACVLFTGKARILTAILAYGSFITMKVLAWKQMSPLGIPLGRPLPMRFLRHLSEEEVRGIVWGLFLNSALLVGLVLAFVMLLVGAVLAEYKSKQKLILANSRLLQYAAKIENQATVEERNRIAREIHDSVGHCLTAQSIQLENVEYFFAEDSTKAKEHLVKARKLGKEALQNVRQSVATLRKKTLQKQSLKTSLNQLIHEFQLTTDIKVDFDIYLISPISNEINTSIYRLVQEALTNVAKHSEANEVNIYLAEKAKKLFLTVEDNGVGFDPKANTTGFGLQGMGERIEALGGNFILKSQPGAGCKIQVELKLLE